MPKSSGQGKTIKHIKKPVGKKKAAPRKKTGLKKTSSDLLGDWAVDRHVLFRPDRYQYVKKVARPKGCVFCNVAAASINFESLCVYKTQYSMIVLNKFPYNSGHLLVIPLAHSGSLLKISQAEYLDLHQCLQLAVKALTEVYSPQGINIGMNHGASAGAGIPDHLHYHVIPRWSGDLNFFPLICETKVVIETLEDTYRRVSGYLNK